MEEDIAKLIKKNKVNSEVGFNQHEEDAYKHGYICDHFKNYLPAKLRLFKAIKEAEDNKDEKKRILLNAARIYSYTLFENTWYGYLIAYADSQESKFNFNGEDSVTFKNAYLNHLPSFSSAILHFGTCRDLFFPLLKILVYLKEGKEFKKFNQEFLDVKYNWKGSSDYIGELEYLLPNIYNNLLQNYKITNEGPFKNDLQKFYSKKNYLNNLIETYNIGLDEKFSFTKILNSLRVVYNLCLNSKQSSFKEDLGKLLNNNSNIGEGIRISYLDKGEKFLENNKFRNTFAHKLRMLWWKNKECGDSFFIPKELYEAINNPEKNGNPEIVKTRLGKAFGNPIDYEKEISTEKDCSKLISSADILKKTHDTIATFLNETFALILPDEPIA